ncbi:MAG: four helix bundle protein [Candidatus Schekmanbacteria bacterium]|nr:four helix bundle protein [Candidatus Schekmanbacteria bacterium]
MGDKINSFRDLYVYQNAMNNAMKIFEITKTFPPEEKYSLVDQVRRSSRSVCANIAESWRKRRYKNAFIAKLSDAESEAGETQVWIDFSLRCGYIGSAMADDLSQEYEHIIAQIVIMIRDNEKWLIK